MMARRLGMELAVAWAACASGCATVTTELDSNTNISKPMYAAGRAVQDFPVPPHAVRAAVTDALDDLKMTVTRRGRDGTVWQIEARTTDNRTVTVTIRPAQRRTRLGIRVGWFGDEPLSKALLERIGVRLGTLPPAPIPDDPPSSPSGNPFISHAKEPDVDFIREMGEGAYRDRDRP
jgi:Protein of unknown function (DUF3568)